MAWSDAARRAAAEARRRNAKGGKTKYVYGQKETPAQKKKRWEAARQDTLKAAAARKATAARQRKEGKTWAAGDYPNKTMGEVWAENQRKAKAKKQTYPPGKRFGMTTQQRATVEKHPAAPRWKAAYKAAEARRKKR